MPHRTWFYLSLCLLIQNVVSKDRVVVRELFERKSGDVLLFNTTLYSDWSIEAENHKVNYVWESDIQLFTFARITMPSDVRNLNYKIELRKYL